MGAKRAVLVGINYQGTKAELKGCHNDVARMRRCLVDRFGFDESGIRVLIDDGSAPQPTGANIRRELARLVGTRGPGTSSSSTTAGTAYGCPPRPGRTTTPATTSASCPAT